MNDRPGLFTGSGFPQRFATTGGDLIDVYQATTQMTDESGQSFPSTAITLMDRAINQGYYGAFTINFHTDGAGNTYHDPVVAAAQARGVPVVSALQMLTWLDGRNASSFRSVVRTGNQLSFSIAVGAGANGLQAMLPIQGATGTLQSLTRGIGSVTYVTKTIKGVEYAVFSATAGDYTATYDVDIQSPTVVSTVPTGGAADVDPAAPVSATFSEAMDASTINASSFTLRATGATEDVAAVVSYASGVATLTPTADLVAETTYTASLGTSITDLAGNSLSAAPYSWTFTTPAAPTSFTIFGDTPGTANAVDTADYELGVKFRTSVDGTITGVRFYKPAGTAGEHIGKLWTREGVLLASATFVESDSGWQTVAFSSPIAVTAGTTYVASYSWPSGSYYPFQANAFTASGVNNGPLTALQSGVDGGNGVLNETAGAFPTLTFSDANYWVDVIFDTNVDTTAPTIIARTPAPDATGVSTAAGVTVTFDEPMNAATLNETSFTLSASGGGSAVPAAVTYAGTTALLNPSADLAPFTAYDVTVAGSVADVAGNPLGSPATWSFTTGAATLSMIDTTVADFGAGSPSGTYVTDTAGGEVTLAPTVGAEFGGTALPSSGWESGPWTGGSATVAGGNVTVDGAYARTTTLVDPGHVLEFRATFGATTFQNAGFAVDFNDVALWAAFGIANSSDQLYARVNAGTSPENIPLGAAFLDSTHTYRIEWASDAIRFLIDGALVHTSALAITAQMRPVASELNVGGPVLTVDWLRMTPFATSGTFTSRVFSAGTYANWGSLSYDSQAPGGTSVSLEVRTGDTATPGDTWTSWTPVAHEGVIGGIAPYAQYRATLDTTDPASTPVLSEVRLSYTNGAPVPNRAPTITNPPTDQTSQVGDPVSLDIDATDPDGDALTYSATGLPTGLDINPTSGLISGVLATVGNYSVVVTVTDDGEGLLTGTASFNWTVNPAPIPSGFIDTTVTDFSAGSPSGTYVTDTAGGELTLAPMVGAEFGGSTLPGSWSAKTSPWTTGGTYSVATGQLMVDGTMVGADATFGPGHSLEFAATFGAAVSQHVGFVGDLDFNNPWVIVSTGLNGDGVYARSNAGQQVSLGSGLLGAEHRYRIDWTAAGFEFYVDGALTPAATLPAVAGPMLVGASDYNADGPALSVDWLRMTPYATSGSFESRIFEANQMAGWQLLSADTVKGPGTGVGFEFRTGNIATPDETWTSWTDVPESGALNVNARYLQYRASLTTIDADVTPILREVQLTLGEPITNRAPTFNQDLGDQTDAEGDLISLAAGASDLDGDSLTYAASGLPTGLSIDTATGLISGTIAFSAALASPWAVEVTVSDGIAADVSDSFSWTVTDTNRAPTFNQDLGDQTDAEGDLISLAAGASDLDGDSLTYAASGLPTGLSIDTATGLISGTIAFSAALASPWAVEVTVSDGIAADVSDSFSWTVTDTNRAPTFNQDLGDQTDAEGDLISLAAGASDLDGDSLTYAASGLPTGLSIDTATGLISGTIAFSAALASPWAVEVTVSDGIAADVSDSFSWTVTDTNRAPTFNQDLGDQTDAEGDLISLAAGASDLDGDSLTYAASGLPTGLSIDTATGLISGTIAFSAALASPWAVEVTVSDGIAADVSDSFSWTVTDTNRAPTFNQDLGDQTDAEGDLISLAAGASDLDGDSLTYAASGLPTGLSIDTATGLISGTIAFSAALASPWAVEVTVSDGIAADVSDSFSWTVTDTNRAPTFNQDLGDQTDAEGDLISLAAGASDLDGDSLTYAASGLPTGLSIDTATGLISGTIAFSAALASPWAVEVTVSDGIAADVSDSFSWTVTDTNRAPTFNQDLGDQTDAEGDLISLAAGASDLDGDSLTYAASGLPTGLSIDTATGLISGTIAFSAALASPWAVEVTVSDGIAADVSDSFSWTVTDTNRAPTFNQDLGDQTDAEGDLISLAAGASDLDGDSLTYAASGLPTGLSIDTATGLISGTIAFSAALASPWAVEVTVSDGIAADVSDSFSWTVTDTNRAPTFNQDLGDQTDAEGDLISLAAGASDLDGDSLTYAASGLPTGLSIDTATGLISGTIAFSAALASPWAVEVTVSDGIAADVSDSFSWTVTDTNRAPTFNQDLGDQTDAEGDLISLAAGASDLDGDSLTYAASGLPTGLSIDTATGLISGTIAFSAALASPWAVEVTVSDGIAADVSDSFSWTVTDTNRAPTFNQDLGDQTDAEGDLISLAAGASDLDGDSLTYAASGLPTGLSIDTATGLISGTIAFSAALASPWAVEVTVSDGIAADVSDSFSWTVTDTNRAPTFNQDLGDQTDAEGDLISLAAGASDLDGDSLTYAASGLPTGLSIDTATGLISGTIAFSAALASPWAVEVTVSDGIAADVSDSFSWTVTDTNRAPTFNQDLGDQTDAEGDLISLAAGASDLDGDSLTYAASGLPTGLSIDTATGLISGTIAFSAALASPWAVEVTVSDGIAADVSDSFSWTVSTAADHTAPNAPTGLTASVSTVAVTLNWTANTEPDLAGYRVYRSVDGAAFTQLTTSVLTTTTLTDAAAPTQVALTYQVVALDATGNVSEPSATASAQRDIWFRGMAVAQNGAKSNSITVPRPAGTAAGDLLVTIIDVRGAATVTPPSGWILAREDVSGNAVRQVTYYRIAAATEPASYRWGLSAKQGASAVSAAYGGVHTQQPLDVSGGQAAANSTTITAPSVTTTADGALLIGAFGIASNTTIGSPGGMVVESYISMNSGQNKVATQLSDQLLGGAGATGSRTATASVAGANIGQAIAFRPSGAVVDPGDAQPPTQPTGLSATAISQTQVNLTWVASTDNMGVTGYHVYRNGTQIATAVSGTTYSDTTVAANTSYAYQVRAVDAAGNLSALSNQATVTTPGAPPPPPAPISFVGASSGANKIGTSVTIPLPRGAQQGDVVVASVDVGGSQTITPPGGWTLIRTDAANGQMTKATYWHTVVAGELAYTWTFAQSVAASGVMAAYRGVDTLNPIVASGGQESAAASAAIVAPSIATEANTMLVAFYGTATNATVTPAAGMTKRSEAVSSGQLKMTSALADQFQASAGVTGARQATASKAASNIGHLIGLRAAS